MTSKGLKQIESLGRIIDFLHPPSEYSCISTTLCSMKQKLADSMIICFSSPRWTLTVPRLARPCKAGDTIADKTVKDLKKTNHLNDRISGDDCLSVLDSPAMHDSLHIDLIACRLHGVETVARLSIMAQQARRIRKRTIRVLRRWTSVHSNPS